MNLKITEISIIHFFTVDNAVIYQHLMYFALKASL